jgi:hypothetical protein
VNKGYLTRPQLFVISLVILLFGAGWSIFQKAKVSARSEGSVTTTGAVLSVARDSIGCDSKLPFAAHDCRVVIKIRHRPAGALADSTFIHVDRSYYLPAPELKQGDPVTGVCESTVGLVGRCFFDQTEELPQQFKVISIMAVLFAAVFALVYLRRR